MPTWAVVDGQRRARSLPETLDAARVAAARAGVTRLADVSGLAGFGIPVFQAVRPRSRSLSVSQGKGLTPMAAKVSALLEAAELWTVESFDSAAGAEYPTIDADALHLRSERADIADEDGRRHRRRCDRDGCTSATLEILRYSYIDRGSPPGALRSSCSRRAGVKPA